MDSFEKRGEHSPKPRYNPTLVASSDAEAARLREAFSGDPKIKIDPVGTDHPTDATSRIRVVGDGGLNPETLHFQAGIEERARQIRDAGPNPGAGI